MNPSPGRNLISSFSFAASTPVNHDRMNLAKRLRYLNSKKKNGQKIDVEDWKKYMKYNKR